MQNFLKVNINYNVYVFCVSLQMGRLRSLTDSDQHMMQDNFRPPVPVNGRLVRASFPQKAGKWGYLKCNGKLCSFGTMSIMYSL